MRGSINNNIPSSNLLSLGNYDVIYDEIYYVIDEVTTRKFRVSMEPFCDLKIIIIIMYRVTYLVSFSACY